MNWSRIVSDRYMWAIYASLIINILISIPTTASVHAAEVDCGIIENVDSLPKREFENNLFGWIQKLLDSIFPSGGTSNQIYSSRNCKIVVFLAPLGQGNGSVSRMTSVYFLENMITQNLKFPGFFYDVKMLCEKNKSPVPLIPSLAYLDSSQWNNLMTEGNVKRVLDSKCDVEIKDLDSVIKYIDDSLRNSKGGKLFLYIQIPWIEIDESTKRQLMLQVSRLPGKERISGIYLFGNDGNASGKVAEIFHNLQTESTIVRNSTSDRLIIETMVKLSKSDIEAKNK